MEKGEKKIKECKEGTKQITTPSQRNRSNNASTKELIRIKTKNVQSIKNILGDRDEAVIGHLRKTSKESDAWVLIETWRNEPSEIIDLDGEAESEEDVVDTGRECQNGDSVENKAGHSRKCDTRSTTTTEAEI